MFDLKLDWKSEQPLGYLPPLKSMIVVLVESATQVAHRNLPRVSPDEIVHAVVFACAQVAVGVPIKSGKRTKPWGEPLRPCKHGRDKSKASPITELRPWAAEERATTSGGTATSRTACNNKAMSNKWATKNPKFDGLGDDAFANTCINTCSMRNNINKKSTNTPTWSS